MFTNKRKIGKSSNVIEAANRLLRTDMGLQASLISSAKADREDVYSEVQKEVRNAMIEAEYEKAKAIMATQQHRNFY
jgi:L-fucose mutarotase/ribose pyranase (RbsD/FucU family)